MLSDISLEDIELQRIYKASQKRFEMFLGGKQTVFDPTKYIQRVNIEKQIAQFASGNQTAALVIGPSGAGKTVLFCMLAKKYLAEGNLVLICEGPQLVGAALNTGIEDLRVVIENTITRELDIRSQGSLENSLARLNQLLDNEDKNLFLFFDAIEKFSYGSNKVHELLLSLNSLVSLWATHDFNRIKVFINCVDSAWMLLPTYSMLEWDLYFTPLNKYTPLEIDRYTDEEFSLAFEKYIGISPDVQPELFARVYELCERDPYMLQIVSELDKKLLPSLPSEEVFNTYYEAKVIRAESGVAREKLLQRFTKKMLQFERDEIPTVDIDVDDPAYELLINEGILVQVEEKEPSPQSVTQLNHSRLSSYLLTRYLLTKYDPFPSIEELTGLIDIASRGFFSLWGAIADYLATIGDEGLFLQLAGLPDYDNQEMVVDSLVELDRRHGDKVIEVLKSLFREEGTRPVGLRTAVELHRMADIREEFGKWAWEQPSAVANYVRLLWKEYQDTKVGEGRWDELEAIRDTQMGPDISLAKMASSKSISLVAEISWRIFLDDCHDLKSVEHLSRFWSETWQLLLKDPRLIAARLPGIRSLALIPKIKGLLRDFIEWKLGLFIKEFASPEPDPKKALVSKEWPGLPIFPTAVGKVARLLDWDAKLSQFELSREEIISLLCSPPLPQNRMEVALVAMTAAIQTLRDFNNAKPTLEYLFETANKSGRLALLTAFSIYALGLHGEKLRLSSIGDDIVDTIYGMTERVLTDNPEYLTKMEDPWHLLHKYNMTLALAPLGFAYCNLASSKKPYIEPILTLIKKLNAPKSEILFRSSIRGLASIGIYFPNEALATLAEMGAFATADPQTVKTTQETLQIIQVFNATKVLPFLKEMKDKTKHDFEPERLIGRPLELLLDYTQWIGNVNFIYHVSQYPTLRCIVIGTLIGLTSKGGTSKKVIRRTAQILVDMIFEKQVSLEKLLNDPMKNPESIIKKIAGERYVPPDRYIKDDLSPLHVQE